ncbi:hypothetical protein [Pseudacidobacterium ailaaui]|jgi:hypothetical protein|uniref:hypothetical protein n=1 Tax=Pseudacidobacterium ailaaui TaxID=1382359 RepID=UPI00192E4A39|nr:hypothetical protein [Pseudacidobacterium ailaaui]MBX6359787.1 hypothetical protein [Pseudacidobacterium ailaaui]MCL6463652.1 hypothetical protein [Pseudacidobacterium ailaaui]MDI3255670.1 hypothetical protein [Bacillota bacterium]
MARKKPKKFSIVKAVKATARQRVGQPRPERAIQEKPDNASRKAKHKTSLSDLLADE